MKWYILAFLVWLLEILLCATIILIPICWCLRNRYDWFYAPLESARINDDKAIM